MSPEGRGPAAAPITALDEAYAHQMVAPRALHEHVSVNWQERCYHLLFADDELMVNFGRSVWPQLGVRRAFLGIGLRSTQHCVRTEVPFEPGEDPDLPAVGGIRVEVVKPLEEVQLAYRDPDGLLRAELTWRARFAPVATEPHLIEQEGEAVTHYMNFFQPGTYEGYVEVNGERLEITPRHGFRDRGWGVRKHEGAPRRGLVLSTFCELPNEALYVMVFETASGRRVLTNGWLLSHGGAPDPVVTMDHILEFDSRQLLSGGTLAVRLASGRALEVTIEPRRQLFLSGVGYSPLAQRQAPGTERFDVGDPDVIDELRGQTDHGCRFDVDGVAGHGYVETGLGTHARYRPEQEGS